MDKRYNSEAMMVAHDLAQDLFEAGAISKEEMKEHDRDCLIQTLKAAPEAAQPPVRENITPAIV